MTPENSIDNRTAGLLKEYGQQMDQELESILSWWMKYAADRERGGWFGQVNNENIPNPAAPKGLVLHSRILWSFSAASTHTGNSLYRPEADRAFDYLAGSFRDRQYGGMYWSVQPGGEPLDDKKQVYGVAFALYAFAEYARLAPDSGALELACSLFRDLEAHAKDGRYGGYFEAFERNWQPREDQRLSEKEENFSKSMNTHLHVIEAYANLYRIWKEPELATCIRSLLRIFQQYIIDPESQRQHIFFTEDWAPAGALYSYGHDIEAAWLLLECAEILGDTELIKEFRRISVGMAAASMEAIDTDGGLWYEYDFAESRWIKEKHWWPQAEAMVGFLNAWQVSGDQRYLHGSLGAWQFTREYLHDKKNGEWFWGIDEHYGLLAGKDKAGFWKCPYHNSRACLEISRRLPH